MSFKLVFFSSNNPEGYSSKPHFIPESMLEDACAELCERFAAKTLIKDVTEGLIDLPGMVLADRTYEEFDLGRFRLSIPTSDILHYFKELKDGELREINGKSYYKIHGWIHCIMITTEMRDMILAQIESNLEAIDRKMHEEQKEFDRRINEINKNDVKIITAPRSMPKDKKLN